MCLRWIYVVCMRGSLDTWSQMWTWENKAVLILHEVIKSFASWYDVINHISNGTCFILTILMLLLFLFVLGDVADVAAGGAYRFCYSDGGSTQRTGVRGDGLQTRGQNHCVRARIHTLLSQIKPIWLIWHIWCWFANMLYKTTKQHANTP